MKRIVTCLFAASLIAAAGAQEQKEGPSHPQNEPAADSAAAKDNFVIGPQDVLQITVWHETELSGSVPVRPDGKISIALLHDVRAAGLTPMQLTDDLKERLKKYIQDPQVSVTVTQVNSQRVYVIGEVGRAGPMPMTPGMTVLQAISSAGGLSQFANAKKIYVLRQEGGTQQKLAFNYKQALKGENPAQNIELRTGDTIVVP